MAWTLKNNPFAQNKSAATSITSGALGVTVAVTVGVSIVLIAKDNVQTTDGNTSEVTSVTDTQGNTYTKIREFCNGQGNANAGAVISAWWCSSLTTALGATDTVTVNFSSSITAKTIEWLTFEIGSGNAASIAGTPQDLANDGADPGSQTISGLTSAEYNFIRATAYEAAPVTGTATTNYTKDSTNQWGTSGGSGASNMSLFVERRIFTGTGDTSDPTVTSADCASIYFALKEEPTGTNVALTGKEATASKGTFGVDLTPKTSPVLSSTNKTSGFTLSNGDLTASTTTPSLPQEVLSTFVIGTSDKIYAEFSIDSITGGAGAVRIGLCELSFFGDGTTIGGNPGTGIKSSVGFEDDGYYLLYNGSQTGPDTNFDFATGDVVCIAVDRPNNKFWFRINNGIWVANGSADPVTNTGGNNIYPGGQTHPSGDLYFVLEVLGGAGRSATITANFGGSSFAFTKPSGFNTFGASSLIGFQATLSKGTLTPIQSTDVALTGQQASATIGSFAGLNSNVTPTGQQATTSKGNFTANFAKALSGFLSTTAAGALSIAFAFTPIGVQATASPGSLSIGSQNFQLTGQGAITGVGILTANTVSDTNVALTGFGSTAASGSFTPVLSVGITNSQQLTGAIGNFGISPQSFSLTGKQASVASGSLGANFSFTLAGQQVAISKGTFGIDEIFVLTGFGSTGATGLLTPSGGGITDVPLTGQQVSGTIGSFGVATQLSLVGAGASGSIGALAASYSLALTGKFGTSGSGSLGVNFAEPLTGVQVTGNIGILSPSAGGSVALTGFGATGSAGALAPASTLALAGKSASLAGGSLAPVLSATLPGQGAIASLGALAPRLTLGISGYSTSSSIGILTPSVTLITEYSDLRTIHISLENRNFTVQLQNRVMVIPSENRRLLVPIEDRLTP